MTDSEIIACLDSWSIQAHNGMARLAARRLRSMRRTARAIELATYRKPAYDSVVLIRGMIRAELAKGNKKGAKR